MYSMIGVVGSRSIHDYDMMKDYLNKIVNFDYEIPIEFGIVSGGASGVDALAKKYAIENSYHYIEVPAIWSAHGQAAGILRNPVIVHLSDLVVAFWDGTSRGTKNTINHAIGTRTPTVVITNGKVRSYNTDDQEE